MPFTCSICGEESTRICARCTKDSCNNHLCDKCLRCSDCCECEVVLSEAPRPVVRPVHRPVHSEDLPYDTDDDIEDDIDDDVEDDVIEEVAVVEPEPVPDEPTRPPSET